MKSYLIAVLALTGFAQAGLAKTYVGSADSGIALDWPQRNSLAPSGRKEQVYLEINRTHVDAFGHTSGTILFNVGSGEGHHGRDFTGEYTRQGNRLFLYFHGRRYAAARPATLIEDRHGNVCVSIRMSTSRPAVVLCEGAPGL